MAVQPPSGGGPGPVDEQVLPSERPQPTYRGVGRSPAQADDWGVSSPKRLARIAGVLYLFVGIFGGFSEGFFDPKMYSAGNAALGGLVQPAAPA